ILVGKPFQVVLQWAAEIEPTLLVLARHGAHRIEGTDLGSQAENLVRLATCNVLLVGTVGVRPEDIPWIEEDGQAGLPWGPTAEEIALAEVKAQEQLKATKVRGSDADPEPAAEVEVTCPVTGAVSTRARVATDPVVWTEEAWARLQAVPLIARPLARNTVERF